MARLEKFKPMPHQLLMRDYLLTPKSDPMLEGGGATLGGFLFAEMRTGKTLGTILFMLKNRKSPILIISPCNALKNWHNWLVAQGFKEHLVSLAYGSKPKRIKELEKGNPILICNYEMSLTYKLKYRKKWEVIVFDESFVLSSINARVTQYWMRGERPKGQARVMITGDPAPEKPLNFATQYFVCWGSFMGYTSYNQYYIDNWYKCQYSGQQKPLSIVHEGKIREYVQETAHCVTMESLGLGSETLYNTHYFEMNAKQIAIMKKVDKLREAAKQFVGIDPTENPQLLKARAMERAVAGGIDPDTHVVINKAKQEHIIECFIETREPLVVFSTLLAPLFELVSMCEKKGIKIGLIYGSSGSPEEKEDVKDAFLRGELDIIAGQTDAVMMNYDFSISSKAFYLTNGYKRNPRSQSEKRITNVKKRLPVEINDMCYDGTLDEVVVNKLKTKGELSYSFIDMKLDELCG